MASPKVTNEVKAAGGKPSDYGLCVPQIKDLKKCKTQYFDVTGDKLPDEMNVCEEATVSWENSDPVICRKIFEPILTTPVLDKFVGTTGSATTPISRLLRPATAPLFCEDSTKAMREFLDIETGGLSNGGDGCFSIPHGNDRLNKMLSYRPQATVSLVIDDIRNAAMKKYMVLEPSDSKVKVGIGSTGIFKLKNGQVIKGIIFNMGFSEWGGVQVQGKEVSVPKFPASNFKLYIYTVSGKENGLVKLSDVESFTEGLSSEDDDSLTEKFNTDHMSIKDIQDDLDKNQPPLDKVIILLKKN